MASLQATSLQLLPLLLLAGVLDSHEMDELDDKACPQLGLGDPIHKSLKRTMNKGDKEGGKSLDVGGEKMIDFCQYTIRPLSIFKVFA